MKKQRMTELVGTRYFAKKGYTYDLLEDKLGQLEDIEDDLGIDLALFAKVMSKRVVYIKGKELEWGGLENATENDIVGYHVESFDKNWLDVRYSPSCDLHGIYEPLKKYGKEWALTREELL